MSLNIPQEFFRIIPLTAAHQVAEHACQLLNIRFLPLHIRVVGDELGQLLRLLRCEIDILRDCNLLLHSLIAGRKTGQLLVNRAVQILRLFLYDADIFLIVLQHGRIRYITADPAARTPAQNLPGRGKIQLPFPLPVSGGHDNRAHVDLADHFLISIQPAGIQELVHIAADPVPLHRTAKDNTVGLFKTLRQRCDTVLQIIQMKGLHRNAEFFQHFLHFIQDKKRRIVHQSPPTIININLHPNLHPFLFCSVMKADLSFYEARLPIKLKTAASANPISTPPMCAALLTFELVNPQ